MANGQGGFLPAEQAVQQEAEHRAPFVAPWFWGAFALIMLAAVAWDIQRGKAWYLE